MGLKEDVENSIGKTLTTKWTIRDGKVVPNSDDVQHNNHGVRLDATVLYTDLAGSTEVVRDYYDWFAAEVFSCFLESSVRIIRHFNGSITSFDGDRVMGVFLGGSKNTNAAKAALKINSMVQHILQPKIRERYPKGSSGSIVLKHCSGIDTGTILAARAGIRGSNDLIWVGKAANYAAVLSDMRSVARTFITEAVYNMLGEDAKYGANGKNMWESVQVRIKDRYVNCYSSTWHWKL